MPEGGPALFGPPSFSFMSPLDPANWPPLKMVECADALAEAVACWRAEGIVGIDTESNSFFAYRDRLCLLQASTHDQDWIVDPIALGEDLQLINPLLEDPGIVKIFHSAEYDLMLLKQDLGVEMRGLFDTQVAMTLLSYERTGLAHLLETEYGIKVSKKEQRSNWGLRPLSAQQLRYARTDTHFLVDLRQRLLSELESHNMLSAATGEFGRLETEILQPREPDLDGWKRMKKARGLDGAAKARLRELFRWREQTADQQDRPVFRVMANETLIELAAEPPHDLRDLSARKGVGWSRGKRIGDEVLAALGRAKGQVVEAERVARVDPAERRRRRVLRDNLEALRNWRKTMARELDLPSERLLHRRHLEQIAQQLPRTRDDLLRTVSLNDWQREHLEDSLLTALAALPDPETT